MSSVEKSPGSKFSVQTIVLSEIAWAVLALLFFALFGITGQGEDHPFWYSLGTLIFEEVAFLAAAILCFKNWGSSQIVSGRNVWLGIGLGMLFYFLGNLLFGYWELGLGLEPAVSPGDFFFILTYLLLLWGMFQAVFSRRLNLELWQKGVVFGIAVLGIAIAVVLAKPAAPAAAQLLAPPAYAQTSQPAPAASPTTAPAATEQKPPPPQWASSLEEALKPFEVPVQVFYLVCDTLLLVLATTLLLAFWGGRFSQSWRMIAIAAFFLYLADMWFRYATNSIPNYQSGSLPEVTWVFSGVLFGIGAALEFDLSSRSRRPGSRRKA